MGRGGVSHVVDEVRVLEQEDRDRAVLHRRRRTPRAVLCSASPWYLPPVITERPGSLIRVMLPGRTFFSARPQSTTVWPLPSKISASPAARSTLSSLTGVGHHVLAERLLGHRLDELLLVALPVVVARWAGRTAAGRSRAPPTPRGGRCPSCIPCAGRCTGGRSCCRAQAGRFGRGLPFGCRCSERTFWSIFIVTPPIASTIFLKPPKLMIAPASKVWIPVSWVTVLASRLKPCGTLVLAVRELAAVRHRGVDLGPAAAEAGLLERRDVHDQVARDGEDVRLLHVGRDVHDDDRVGQRGGRRCPAGRCRRAGC